MIVFRRSVVAIWAVLALTLAVRNVRGTTPTSRPPVMVETPDGGGTTRVALLEQALGLQQNLDFEAAANMYIALLQASTCYDCAFCVANIFVLRSGVERTEL